MDAHLIDWILEQIARNGPIPFAGFMECALYHPQYGYYSSGRVRVGEDAGDFITAPHLSAVFARCVARFAAAVDRELGAPDPFTFMEGGPGEGIFAVDFLDAVQELHPDLYPRLAYALDEVSPVLRQRQLHRLRDHAAHVSAGRPSSPVHGVYFSNELVDALPVHRLVLHQGRLLELHVDRDGRGLQEVLLPPSSPTLVEACAQLPLAEDCQVEVRPEAARWLCEVNSLLERGCILTVDYGDVSDRLFGRLHPDGTCVAYRRHRQQTDLLAHPGEQDLTAQVDFTALGRSGRECGLQAAPLLRQRDFLLASGLLEEVERLEELDLPEADKMLLRQSLAPLIMPGSGMGESFKVLIQTKGVSPDLLPVHLSG